VTDVSAEQLLVAAPQRRALIPREMLWTVVGMPPVLVTLVDGEVMTQPLQATLHSMVGIGLYSLACAIVTHTVFELVFDRYHLLVPSAVRFLLFALLPAVAVIGMTVLVAPLLRRVCPGMVENVATLAQQGVVVTWLYIVLGFSVRAAQERLLAAHERSHHERNRALEARLRALTARTNPHFLFNTLNAGMSLIATDPEGAEELLGRLSSLFRYALEGSAKRYVRLAEEVAAVRDYLEIERARFGDRLSFEIDQEDGLADRLVPPMVLQPLAENAVLHGLQSRVEGGSVRVRLYRRGERFHLVVDDDGVGLKASTHRGSGTALSDLRERLEIVYRGEASLSTTPRPGGGTRSEIVLPWSSR
jgi:signal transduction histidine kinase